MVRPSPGTPNWGKPGAGEDPDTFHADRKLSGGYYWQLQAYDEVLALCSGGLSRALRPLFDRSGSDKHKPDK